MDESIRFGLICAGTRRPAWQARCLEELASLEGVECAMIVRPPASAPPRGLGPRLFSAFRDGFSRPRAYRETAAPSLDGVPVLECADFGEEACRNIRRFGLDFILHFEGPEPEGPVLHAARCGIWSFRFSNGPGRRPTCFWEIVEGEPVTSAALCRLVGPGKAVVLKQGGLKTAAHSYRRSVDEAHFTCAHWPREVCVDLRNGNVDSMDAPPLTDGARLGAPPTTTDVLRFFWKLARNLAAQVARDLFRHEQWTVGVARRPIESFLDAPSVEDVEWLPTLGRNVYLADPFAVTDNGERRVLAEFWDYRNPIGRIVSVSVEEPRRRPKPVTAIEEPCHLSYPYTFEHEGETLCIPDASHSREIAVYRAVGLPARWERVACVIEGVAAADPTLFHHGDRYWLAYNDVERGLHRDLFLWYAESPLGPWRPHATNPVKIDVRSARPAGTPFVHGGELYRPAQNCARRYGGEIVINRVTHLSPTCFREIPVATVSPAPDGPFPDGVHTLSAAGGATLLDAKRHVFSPFAMVWIVRNALRKRLR